MDHVIREVRKSFLVRNLGDLCRETAKIRFLLDQEGGTSNFRCRTGCFHPCSTAAYNDHVAWLCDLMFLIVFSLCDSRIDGAADGAVDADTVSGASDITGDTFSDITDISELYFVYPFRISDQSAADPDQVRIPSREDVFSDMRITDISHGDAGLVVFLFYGFCHIGTPSVREMVGVDLVLDGSVQSAGYVDDVRFFLDILQIVQAVVQRVSAFQKFVCADTEEDREEGTYLASYFLHHETGKACTVLCRASELIRSLVCERREELAEKIGVAGVDLHTVKTGCLRAFCSFSVFFYDAHDLIFFQRTRDLAALFGGDV